MSEDARQREQAAAGLEQLSSLVRAQSWRNEGTPSLPPTQAAVLRMLAGSDEGLRARQIADRLGVSAASLSDSLKAMEAKEWIARSPDPDDKRASVIRLKRSGRALATRLNHPARGMVSLLQGLDTDDVGALLRVTQLLVGQAQQQGLATGLRTCMGCEFFKPFGSGDAARPHYCGFIRAAFGDAELRTDCADQSPADDELLAANRERFRLRLPP
ncbi:MarR family winged helix-turn-helix transcriptional regulator [Lysobacter panacisoli]|uniref:HTH marR-type domain-containing protein n=1 Tax=Lysobacter panacisoli TaxID=1255263 RepID=A0ABP9L9F4_9GAMM|nr:MarR family transcriptional regulator [Lysobacter panacisoli]